MTDKIGRNEAIALLKGPFGSEFLKNAAAYVDLFFWLLPVGHKMSVKGNGSIFFLCPEGRSLVVSANHVYHGWKTLLTIA